MLPESQTLSHENREGKRGRRVSKSQSRGELQLGLPFLAIAIDGERDHYEHSNKDDDDG